MNRGKQQTATISIAVEFVKAVKPESHCKTQVFGDFCFLIFVARSSLSQSKLKRFYYGIWIWHMKHRDNYEYMKEKMQLQFLEYDQEAMIRKFGLRYDTRYLHLTFVGREYRISRTTGAVEWTEDGFATCCPANYNEAMSIYDVLCCSKDNCSLSGRFVTTKELMGMLQGSNVGGGMFQKVCAAFDRDTELFKQACEGLGGRKESGGDAAYSFWVFPFLPMMLRFWNSDEEFPASLVVLWDANVLDYMHFETTWFAAGHLLARIQGQINRLKQEAGNG